MRDDRLFALAGLWDEWDSPDGSPLRTCTIITVAPNEVVGSIHNRMPAILGREDISAWLDPSLRAPAPVTALLRPYPDAEMAAIPVASHVNVPTNEGPACVAPLA